jgi:hypothetical protein
MNTINSRIQCNKHFAGDLRRRLEQRHAVGSRLREAIDRLSDYELVEQFQANQRQGRARGANDYHSRQCL